MATTTRATLRQRLSEEMGDYQSLTTTSDGNSAGTSVVDTGLRNLPGGADDDAFEGWYILATSGSNTDFVFPYVEDHTDQDVEIYMGTQISSNDRTRLINSELKEGGQRYLFTGNGMTASTKNLKDIGNQIISSLEGKNVKIGVNVIRGTFDAANTTNDFLFAGLRTQVSF